MLLVLLIACTPQPRVPPPEPAAQARPIGDVDGGLFLQGFDVRWQARPHRLSRMAFAARGSARGHALTGELLAEVRGGTWASGAVASDVPELSLRYGGLVGPELTFLTGTAELTMKGQLERRESEPAAGSTVVEVALPEGEDLAVAAWLTGFELGSGLSHPNGYTPHALEVWLDEPVVTDGVARMEVRARLEAAPVPDRRQKLGAYGAVARVHWAVAAVEGGVSERFGVHTAMEEGIEPLKLSHRKAAARFPVSVSLPAGPPTAVAGLSGFAFHLEEYGPVAGRYMRALTAGLEDARYDPARGSFDALVALRFANAGQLSRRVKVDAAAAFTALQLPGQADVRSGRWDPPVEGQRHRVSYPELRPLD